MSVQKVTADDQTWSVSCLSCPSLLTFGVNIFPSNDSHKYVDLPDKVSSALCGVGRVNSHVCGGYCTCVWRAVYMCIFAYMYICVCIAIVHIPTVLIFAICYMQSFMVVCETAKGYQVT